MALGISLAVQETVHIPLVEEAPVEQGNASAYKPLLEILYAGQLLCPAAGHPVVDHIGQREGFADPLAFTV
ncbi:hypothetical protein D3C75_1100430 [compost metagenome]